MVCTTATVCIGTRCSARTKQHSHPRLPSFPSFLPSFSDAVVVSAFVLPCHLSPEGSQGHGCCFCVTTLITGRVACVSSLAATSSSLTTDSSKHYIVSLVEG